MISTREEFRTSERLIVALDVPGIDEAKNLVATLDDAVSFYKIGLELAMSGQFFELMRWLLDNGKRVFADLKFYDIPATVAAATRQLADSGATLLTVHGDRKIMQAAAQAKGELKIVAVTVLTSIGPEDLREMGVVTDLSTLVLERAAAAVESGCDGVVASGLEAPALRARLGPDPLIVTPGIRLDTNVNLQDQKRVVTPRSALENGASFIVVGRPVRDAADPYAAAKAIQAEIAAARG